MPGAAPKTDLLISGKPRPVGTWVQSFKKCPDNPAFLKSYLAAIKAKNLNREHGAFQLTAAKERVNGLIFHTNNEVRILAADALRVLNGELSYCLWPENLDRFADKLPADQLQDLNSILTEAASHSGVPFTVPDKNALCAAARGPIDETVKTRIREVIKLFVDRGLIPQAEVNDILNPPKKVELTAEQKRIDEILNTPLPNTQTALSYHALVATIKEIETLMTAVPHYKDQELLRKKNEAARLSGPILKSKIPREALITEPFPAKTSDGIETLYEVTDEIASGGFGVVVKGRKVEDKDNPVAIKFLSHDAVKKDPTIRNRFLGEADLMIKLNHPHIARGFAVGEVAPTTGAPDQLFIVMEYIQTTKEADIFGQGPKRKSGIAIKAAQGLLHLWQQNKLHRDIKLGNFLIALGATEKDDVVKVADFGLAKNLATLASEEQTATGIIQGTLSHMAPEIFVLSSAHRKAANKDETRAALYKALTIKTDVYAYGIFLYHLFTGEVPGERKFDPKNPREWVIFSLSNGQVAEIYTLKYDPRVPKEFWPIIVKATEHNPANRHQTGEELLEALVQADAQQMPTMSASDAATVIVSCAPEILAAQGLGGQADLVRLLELDVNAKYPLDSARTEALKDEAVHDRDAILAAKASLEKFDPTNSNLQVLADKIKELNNFIGLSQIPEVEAEEVPGTQTFDLDSDQALVVSYHTAIPGAFVAQFFSPEDKSLEPYLEREENGDYLLLVEKEAIDKITDKILKLKLTAILKVVAKGLSLDDPAVIQYFESITLRLERDQILRKQLEKKGAAGKTYQYLGELGKGAEGEVTKVKCLEDGKEYALKVNPRAKREYNLLAKVKHPNVAKVFDHGVTASGDPFLVMELFTGSIYDTYVKQRQLLDPKTSLEITRQVLEGLIELHHRGIYQGDIKPENIFVRPDGSVAIADFDVAIDIGSLDYETNKELVGLLPIASTAPYLSPFLLDKLNELSETPSLQLVEVKEALLKSQLYSLGATLFEMIASTRPFEDYYRIPDKYKKVKEILPHYKRYQASVARPIPDPGMKPEVHGFITKLMGDPDSLDLGKLIPGLNKLLDSFTPRQPEPDSETEVNSLRQKLEEQASELLQIKARLEVLRQDPLAEQAAKAKKEDRDQTRIWVRNLKKLQGFKPEEAHDHMLRLLVLRQVFPDLTPTIDTSMSYIIRDGHKK